jgi:hypothetical protein
VPACPRCQRPVAVARDRCLYCGAPLDPSLVPAAPSAEPEPPGLAEGRALVFLDLSQAAPGLLIEGLGLSPYDADQRVRRGGWQVHRVVAADEAPAEVDRLRAAGFDACWLVGAEIESSSRPRIAEGGRLIARGVELRVEGRLLPILATDVRLVVAGAIQREWQAEAADPFKRRAAKKYAPTPGFRFHVHLTADPRPIEIDPEMFAFDEPLLVPMATLPELRRWIEILAGARGIDDGFRFVPPALGIAAPPEVRDPAHLLNQGRFRGDDANAPKILDNLAQFRFYSGWRGAVERRSG